jgi:hypothetical protein
MAAPTQSRSDTTVDMDLDVTGKSPVSTRGADSGRFVEIRMNGSGCTGVHYGFR